MYIHIRRHIHTHTHWNPLGGSLPEAGGVRGSEVEYSIVYNSIAWYGMVWYGIVQYSTV